MNFFKKLLKKTTRETWSDSLKEELDFWESLAARTNQRNPQWAENFHRRAEADEVLAPELDSLFPPELSEIKILDVGAGPVTQLGSLHPSRRIDLTPIDPLADHYNQLLIKHGVILVRPKTQRAEAEDLVSKYGESKFDLVYSRNALDHSYDPVKAISEMYRVCKPGGYLWIVGSVNEGEKMKYQGLHQWNFEPKGVNDVRIWNKRHETTLNQEYGDSVTIDCSVNDSGWLTVKMSVNKS